MKLSVCMGYTGVMDAIENEQRVMVAKLSHSMPEFERVKLAKEIVDAYNAIENMRGAK